MEFSAGERPPDRSVTDDGDRLDRIDERLSLATGLLVADGVEGPEDQKELDRAPTPYFAQAIARAYRTALMAAWNHRLQVKSASGGQNKASV